MKFWAPPGARLARAHCSGIVFFFKNLGGTNRKHFFFENFPEFLPSGFTAIELQTYSQTPKVHFLLTNMYVCLHVFHTNSLCSIACVATVIMNVFATVW